MVAIAIIIHENVAMHHRTECLDDVPGTAGTIIRNTLHPLPTLPNPSVKTQAREVAKGKSGPVLPQTLPTQPTQSTNNPRCDGYHLSVSRGDSHGQVA